jgi:hypothetical protein
LHTAFRAYSAGGARGVIGAVDDSKLMQEVTAHFMAGERRSRVEAPQNYGFTSVNMPPDMDAGGNITGSAEHFSSFIGGSRSFPVAGVIDDRRHRLKGLQQGDVAMFRTAQDQLQLHLTQGGGFWTGPNTKKLRLQLIQPQQQQGGGQPGQQDASGGGGAGGGMPGQQQKGQQPVYQQNSTQYLEVNNEMTQMVNKNHQLILQDNKTGIDINSNNYVYLGQTQASGGTFERVMLADGSPAKNTLALSYASLKMGSTAIAEGDVPAAAPGMVPWLRELIDTVKELKARVVALECALNIGR